jgi:hypothetical protein
MIPIIFFLLLTVQLTHVLTSVDLLLFAPSRRFPFRPSLTVDCNDVFLFHFLGSCDGNAAKNGNKCQCLNGSVGRACNELRLFYTY